jgi:hypothetical protein
MQQRLPGDICQEAQADPQEPGDPGGGSLGGPSAGDGSEENKDAINLLFIYMLG